MVKEIRINMDGKLDEAIRLAMGKAWPSRSLRSARGAGWRDEREGVVGHLRCLPALPRRGNRSSFGDALMHSAG